MDVEDAVDASVPQSGKLIVPQDEGLVYYAFNGQLAEVLAALSRPGVNINETDPVSRAAMVLLLNSSSSILPDVQDGSTPLMAACWGGHLPIVRVLVASGADIEAKNRTVRGAHFQSNFSALLPPEYPTIVARLESTHSCRSTRAWRSRLFSIV